MKSYGAFTCWGKEFFSSFTIASQVVRRRVRSGGGHKRDREQVYRCGSCRGFHIGSTIKPRSARPRVDLEESEA